MNLQEFGGVPIFRPSFAAEIFVAGKARENLLTHFRPGIYRGAKEVNRIIHHQFRFYDQLLRAAVPSLKSTDAEQFFLFQFDEASRVQQNIENLDDGEDEAWTRIGPVFRRGIKYIVECLCASTGKPDFRTNRNEAIFYLESALICAESMTFLAQESDLAHSLFPNDCALEVFDQGRVHLNVKIEGPHEGYDKEFNNRVIRDRRSRYDFTGFPQFDNDTSRHQKYMDPAFHEAFGMSYGEFIAALVAVIEECKPAQARNAFPTLFVSQQKVFEQLAASGRNREAIKLALEGFTINPAKMAVEKRAIWRPKQEHRAYRRGFFLFRRSTGPHYAFSRSMAKENMIQLVSWLCYRHLPPEWSTPRTKNALSELSAAAGNWFEDTVQKNLTSLGATGSRASRTVGTGALRARIPDDVGEIDFIGIHPKEKILIIIEAKMVMTGLEACYWRDDLHEFVYRRGSYAERFRSKLRWVVQNRAQISRALGGEGAYEIGAAMLTLYPCIARRFIGDFQCVSLTEFMLDYKQHCRWPYGLV